MHVLPMASVSAAVALPALAITQAVTWYNLYGIISLWSNVRAQFPYCTAWGSVRWDAPTPLTHLHTMAYQGPRMERARRGSYAYPLLHTVVAIHINTSIIFQYGSTPIALHLQEGGRGGMKLSSSEPPGRHTFSCLLLGPFWVFDQHLARPRKFPWMRSLTKILSLA